LAPKKKRNLKRMVRRKGMGDFLKEERRA